eukprot:2477951-Pleurochrysis_carterae.AAC.1
MNLAWAKSPYISLYLPSISPYFGAVAYGPACPTYRSAILVLARFKRPAFMAWRGRRLMNEM